MKTLIAISFLTTIIASSCQAFAQGDENEIEAYDLQFAELYRARKYDQAEEFAKNALVAIEKKGGPFHPDVPSLLNDLASVYQMKGKYTESQSLLERALVIQEKTSSENPRDLALGLNNLGSLYVTQGRYQQATPLLQRALAINEKIFGPDHPSVAMSLNNLAVLYQKQGDVEKVEPLVQRGLTIRENKLGLGHLDVAVSLNNLAALYDVQGDYTKAASLYQKSLEIFEKNYGTDHFSSTTVLNNLSRINRILNHYARAELFIQRSLAILEDEYGPDHPAVALTLNRVGELRRSQGNNEQAEQLFRRALSHLERTWGVDHTNHPDMTGIIRNLAELLRATQREQEATVLESRASVGRVSLPGAPGNPSLPPQLKLSGDSFRELEIVLQVPPKYPEILRMSGNKGVVMVEILITKKGLVRDPVILESAHPALEQAAIEAALKFRYKPPLTISGRSASIGLKIPIRFLLEGYDDGEKPFALPNDTKGLPEEFQYDAPPVIKVVAPAVYPFELLSKNIEGSAKVSVVIDPRGKVREVKVLEATHTEFGLATRAMMESWIFGPATKDGKPKWAIFAKEQKFGKYFRDTRISAVAEDLLKKGEGSSNVFSLSALDNIPKPLYAPHPAYPHHLKESGITDLVMAEFYIDKEGAVQLPRVVESKNEELGWIALTALSRWRFEPPLHEGKPVVARAKIPIRFTLD